MKSDEEIWAFPAIAVVVVLVGVLSALRLVVLLVEMATWLGAQAPGWRVP